MKDPPKDNKMPNNETQEVTLILHHRLVSLLNSYFTADSWKTNTHFDLLVQKCHAQQNVLIYRPIKISLFIELDEIPKLQEFE